MKISTLMRELERSFDCSVSLEILHPAFDWEPALKLAPDQYLHHSAFCRNAKLGKSGRRCLANKDRSRALARRGRVFAGRCPFGIAEIAVPVLYDGELAAILYGGGKSPAAPVPPGLRVELRLAARLIHWELEFCRERYRTVKRIDPVTGVQRHIDRRYPENLSLSAVAAQLGMNPNYLGSLLRKRTGTGFRELLTARRLEESKILLKLHRGLPIREVALRCGFPDSNYFSAVFHRACGVSPSAFRRR